MSIKNRIKRIENATATGGVCRCFIENIATSKEAFIQPQKCRDCRGVVTPPVLVVGDLLETEDFNYPVKIYAGFDANLV